MRTLRGVSPQRQAGLFMQRVKLPGGRLAKTTALALEVHEAVPAAQVPAMLKRNWKSNAPTESFSEFAARQRERLPEFTAVRLANNGRLVYLNCGERYP